MAGVWNVLLWRLVLGDTALSLFYAVFKNWVSITLVSETLLKNLANLLWKVSGWPETINIGILLPTVSSMTPQKKPAIHHLLCHLLNRPTSQCQIQSQFFL